jgi:hypothetical protein
VAGAISTVPAGQTSSGKHSTWFGLLAYVPESQAAHARSEMLEPDALIREPGSHVVQGAHFAEFSPTLKLPLGQLTHARSKSVAPSLSTRCPGTHTVCVKHAVAAFVSSSHVPGGHGTMGAVPPAQ